MRDVLETWLYTRRWQREQDALHADRLADTILGFHTSDPKKAAQSLHENATALRRPEVERSKEDRSLTEGQRTFMRSGREEAAKE